jgi:hypothetical protein
MPPPFFYARFEGPFSFASESSRPLAQAGGSLAGKLSIDASSMMSDGSRAAAESSFGASVRMLRS